MATLEHAEALLEELRSASHAAAQADKEEVQAFANSQGFEGQLEWYVGRGSGRETRGDGEVVVVEVDAHMNTWGWC